MDPNSDRARAKHFTCAPRVVVLQGALELYPPAAKQNTCDAESVGAKTIVIAIMYADCQACASSQQYHNGQVGHFYFGRI